MVFVKYFTVIALLGSIAWVIAEPGFESSLAVVGSLSALGSAFIAEKRKVWHAQQHQTVSQSSVGIQAGGDVSIGKYR